MLARNLSGTMLLRKPIRFSALLRSHNAMPASSASSMAGSRHFSTGLKEASVCLDWIPNTNHSGIYAAIHEGFLEDEGIELTVIPPDSNASLTPGRKASRGMATFAISSSESAISFATSRTDSNRLVAVAALLQGSTSSICTLQSSGIDRPAKLDNARYASYDGRFEDAIVKQMVLNDGGNGNVKFHSLEDHGYADEETMKSSSVVSSFLKSGASDSTWIFTHWEGILAERDGTKLNFFSLEDYGIPYGYSPVLLTSEEIIGKDPEMISSVLKGLEKGYKFCAENPYRAAEILHEQACRYPHLSDLALLEASQLKIGDKYLTGDFDEDGGDWGRMEHVRWEKWVEFLFQHGIITDRNGEVLKKDSIEDVTKLFTNEFLP